MSTARIVLLGVGAVIGMLIIVPVAYWPIALVLIKTSALGGVAVLKLRRRH